MIMVATYMLMVANYLYQKNKTIELSDNELEKILGRTQAKQYIAFINNRHCL